VQRAIQKGAKDLNQPFKKAKTHLSTYSTHSELIATTDKEKKIVVMMATQLPLVMTMH